MLCGSILAASALNAQPVDFERVLLPVYVRARAFGAFGTQWSTPLWVYNNSDAPVAFVPNLFCPQSPQVASTIPSRVAIIPNVYGTPVFSANEFDAPVPWLAFVDRAHSEDITFGLQLVSPAGTTQLPVIRERNLRTGNVQLLNVPPLQNRRVTIRTYDPDIVANASVTIRISTMRGAPLFTAERTLTGGGGQYCFSDLPAHPNDDVLTLDEQDLPATESLRIEIVADGDVRRLTAMATVTDNITGAVTVITPF